MLDVRQTGNGMTHPVTKIIFSSAIGCCISLSIASDQASEADLLQALHHVEKRELSDAQITLHALCPLDKKDVVSRAKRGDLACRILVFVYYEIKDPAKAKELALPYWLQGEEASERGDYDVAEELYRVSLDRNPKDAGTWFSIGHLYRKTEQLEMAEEAYSRACELDPQEPYMLYWFARIALD